mgnify:CR=1 FL=1
MLTEPAFFDGALEHLAAVRAAVGIPLLRKDFVVDEYQLFEAIVYGADAVLLIVAALDDASLTALMHEAAALELMALVETHTADEVRRAQMQAKGVLEVDQLMAPLRPAWSYRVPEGLDCAEVSEADLVVLLEEGL